MIMTGMRHRASKETARDTSVVVRRPFVPGSLLPFLALMLAGLLILVAVRLQSTASRSALTLQARAADAHVADPPEPADLFIRSVVSRDGDLGWHQLCGAVRSQLSSAALVKTAQDQKAHDAAAGVSLTSAYIGTRPLQQGGTLRFYLLTANWPGGATEHRTYTVHTDTSGCVEDVQAG